MSRVTYGLSALALAAFLCACGYKAAAPVNEVSAPSMQPNLALAQAQDLPSEALPTVVVSARRQADRS